jgi:hypothetical protein
VFLYFSSKKMKWLKCKQILVVLGQLGTTWEEDEIG